LRATRKEMIKDKFYLRKVARRRAAKKTIKRKIISERESAKL